MNPTILMVNGKYFNFENPDDAEYDIEVIAHALSNVCRFAGHTTSFYSVAQHSVYVSKVVPPEYALEGLLHDAAEAFIHDVTKPFKNMLPDYQAWEGFIEASVLKRFGITTPLPPEVKEADMILLATERLCVMPSSDDCEWKHLKGTEPLEPFVPWGPEKAKRKFLQRYGELTD